MSGYGLDSPFGLDSPYGNDGDPGAWGCSLGNARALVQMPDGGVFRRWLCGYTSTANAGVETIEIIKGAFDLDFAVGDQLDKLGAIMGLPRQGVVDDERYRIWLRIQASLLSGKPVGTSEQILRMTRLFIGDAAGAIGIINGVYTYQLQIPEFEDVTEIKQLIRFLRIATWAAVLGIFLVELGHVWAYDENSTVPVPNEGVWAYDENDSIPVPDHLIWSTFFTTDP